MNLLNCGFKPIDDWIMKIYRYLYSSKDQFTEERWKDALAMFHDIMYNINYLDGDEIYRDINNGLADYGWSQDLMDIRISQDKLFIDCHVSYDDPENAFGTILSRIECMFLDIKSGYYNTNFKTIRLEEYNG